MSDLNFVTSVVQLRPVPGNVRENVRSMLEYIDCERKSGAQLIVFGELCTTGYLLGDRWEDDAFIRDIKASNEEICKASKGLTVVWGSIKADRTKIGEDGRVRKYNAAFIAQNGEWVGSAEESWIPKTNLPKYRFFDDARHFYPAAKLAQETGVELDVMLAPFAIEIGGEEVRLALAICEDLWSDEYDVNLAAMYREQGVDLLIDISSSPWTAGKWHARDTMLHKRSKEAGCPILYVNVVGLQNNAKNLVWFDGGSCLYGPDGVKRWMALRYDCESSNTLQIGLRLTGNPVHWRPSVIEEIDLMLVAAMREFFAPYKRVIIGLSGGIDSAVSAASLVKALGPKMVLAINMPTKFNSQTTRTLAEQCAKNLGIEYRVMPIQGQFEARLALLADGGYANVSQFDKENIQARIRGQVLADVCAAEGTKLGGRCAFTCNGNKTEVALNYFTEYGDGAGTVAFFADLWKGQIYELARLYNGRAGRELIPEGIIDIVPSAELSADQNVDEGKGDPIVYPYHDKLLQAFIEKRWDPTVVLERLFKGTLVRDLGMPLDILHRAFGSKKALIANLEWAWKQYSYEGKRHKLPPGFVASRRAFGFDRRETIAGEYFTGEYYRLKDAYLKKAA